MVLGMIKFSIPTPQDIEASAKTLGWSIKRLCEEADISDETFFRWRDRRHNIGLHRVQALLDALKRGEKAAK